MLTCRRRICLRKSDSWTSRRHRKPTKGQKKGNVLRRAIGRGRKSWNFRKDLAPQAGLEPATLRLTATSFEPAGDYSGQQRLFSLRVRLPRATPALTTPHT